MRKPDYVSPCGRASMWRCEYETLRDSVPKADVKALVVDPPYEITATGGGIGKTMIALQKTTGFTDHGFDYVNLDGYRNWVCFGTLRQVPKLIQAAGSRRWMLVTWNKPNVAPLCGGNYLADTEYIVHCWSKGELHGRAKDKARYIVHRAGDKEHGLHPNEKPVIVMRKVLATASRRNDLIFDPFAGSGTTGVAALRMSRRFWGVERDDKFFDVACQRIEKESRSLPMYEELKDAKQQELWT